MSTRKVWRCDWLQPQINLKRTTSKIINTITPAIADTAPQTDMGMLRKYFIKDNLLFLYAVSLEARSVKTSVPKPNADSRTLAGAAALPI